MPEGNLDTTNLLLGILAAMSVIQGLVLIALGVMAYRSFREAMRAVHHIEQRQIAPMVAKVNTLMTSVDGLMTKVDGILGDVKDVTARVTRQAERADSAIHDTIDRVDETTARVRISVASRVTRVLGLIHGARCAVGTMFNGRRASGEAPAA